MFDGKWTYDAMISVIEQTHQDLNGDGQNEVIVMTDLGTQGGEGGYLTSTSFFKPGKLTLARLLKFPDGKLAIHRATGTATGETPPLREISTPFGVR